MRVELPEKLQFLFQPSRYKVAWGGRGGSKSWGFARALLILASQSPKRILCTREYQNSIQESVLKLLADQIDLMGLSKHFTIYKNMIAGAHGSEFIFAGLKTDPRKIKSMEGVDICWVEEAEAVSEDSWQILIPTIRTPNSEIWVSFNPNQETDPTYKRFVVNSPPGAVVQEINWRDNPWFPEELRIEKDYLASVDVEAYEHVWNGLCRKHSAAQILNGKYVIRYFEPSEGWDGPYFGADFGFANDPNTLIKCWINDFSLFIEHEVWGIGMEIDVMPEHYDTIPGARDHVIRADCARPETISYLKRNGFGQMRSVNKWTGSVEDGIARLRAFKEIVIHPRCVHTAEEAKLYSYKTDRLTGDVLPEIVDKHNHCWDAIRYALQPVMKHTVGMGLDLS